MQKSRISHLDVDCKQSAAKFELLLHPEGQFAPQKAKLDLMYYNLSMITPFAAGLPRLTVARAFDQLHSALKETFDWIGKMDRVKELMSDIELHRRTHSRCAAACISSPPRLLAALPCMNSQQCCHSAQYHRPFLPASF